MSERLSFVTAIWRSVPCVRLCWKDDEKKNLEVAQLTAFRPALSGGHLSTKLTHNVLTRYDVKIYRFDNVVYVKYLGCINSSMKSLPENFHGFGGGGGGYN